MTVKAPTGVDPFGLVAKLIDIGNVDTVYRDVYLQRSRTLLAEVFSVDDFRGVEQQTVELATLLLTIGRALEKSDWSTVKELSERADVLRQRVEDKRRQMEVARGVYAVTDVRLDPFSPGLRPFTRISEKELLAIRTQAVEHLATLERADASWKNFYAARWAALKALSLIAARGSPTEAVSMDPREAAQRALKSGDMRALAKLADTLLTAVTPIKARRSGQEPTTRSTKDLLTPHPDTTLKEARRLGLAPRRLESKVELASLRQYAWNPLFSDEPGGRIGDKQIPVPAGTREAFRDRLEMLMIHPLVNSGGARHLPSLVAEDVLVEDFPDPKEGEETPPSELLATLKLPGRRGLPRIAIEQALLARGSDVLDRQLGLDPRIFRLVCIPPDVHLRLGEDERWGRQPFWTHFDGYIVMADGRLRALAGGDVRYGGLYNLLGVGRDYGSDRLIARFAVVRRERMVAWS